MESIAHVPILPQAWNQTGGPLLCFLCFHTRNAMFSLPENISVRSEAILDLDGNDYGYHTLIRRNNYQT